MARIKSLILSLVWRLRRWFFKPLIQEVTIMNAGIQGQLDRLATAATKIQTDINTLKAGTQAAADAADAATSTELEPVVAAIETIANP